MFIINDDRLPKPMSSKPNGQRFPMMNPFSLYVKESGAHEAGSPVPILCLHGHPGSAKSMGIFTQHFARRYWTLAPDLRGYGKSQVRSAFEMETHLEDLIQLLDARGIQQVLVLGWSLGGIFALELALRYPDRVKGLILVATAARPWGDHPQVSLWDQMLTGIAGAINILRPGWQWNIDRLGRRSMFQYLVSQQTPAVYRYLAREAVYAYLKTSRRADRALTRRIQQGYNRVPDLPQITCPSLMLIGEFDRHISPSASLETAKAIPNCQWEVFRATAHLLPWEKPEAMLDRIDRWLEDVGV
jgi:pimeloyl-ACP methyl ester carboxylesterase